MMETITIKFDDYPDFPCQDCVERDICPKTDCGALRKWREKHSETIDTKQLRIDQDE